MNNVQQTIPTPIYDRILVKANTDEEVTPGGLILPAPDTDDDVLRGEVLAVGKGRYADTGELIPMTIEIGMTVAFDRAHAASIRVSGIEYFILDEPSVFAIL